MLLNPNFFLILTKIFFPSVNLDFSDYLVISIKIVKQKDHSFSFFLE